MMGKSIHVVVLTVKMKYPPKYSVSKINGTESTVLHTYMKYNYTWLITCVTDFNPPLIKANMSDESLKGRLP